MLALDEWRGIFTVFPYVWFSFRNGYTVLDCGRPYLRVCDLSPDRNQLSSRTSVTSKTIKFSGYGIYLGIMIHKILDLGSDIVFICIWLLQRKRTITRRFIEWC